MTINRKLREAILKKHSGKTTRRVYQIINEFADQRKIIDRDIAAYAYARDVLKINIGQRKYSIDEHILNQVQTALQSSSQLIIKKEKSFSKKSEIDKQFIFNFTNFQTEDQLLPKRLADEAISMATKVYPIIYIYENSIRNFILKLLEKKYGKEWWNKSSVSTSIKTKVQKRMSNENRNKWHGKRNTHQIYYTDIDDLKNIITNNWNDFESYLKTSQFLIIANIEIIEQSRNVISHNNPLSKDDIDSVTVNFKQWIKIIENIEF